jgi:hypothetical protein
MENQIVTEHSGGTVVTVYNKDRIISYSKTEEGKEQLFNSFIDWCNDHDFYSIDDVSGEEVQAYSMDALAFIAHATKRIIMLKTELRGDSNEG